MQQPQTCTKCNTLPDDILMLACKHDLCLNCAADRLAFEMKKKKPANSIVCQFCYQRTALDADSIGQLQKLIPPPNKLSNSKIPVSTSKSYQTVARDRYSRDQGDDKQLGRVSQEDKYNKDDKYNTRATPQQKTRGYQRVDRSRDYNSNSSIHTSQIVSRKPCNQHPEEEILYFCFDCKCQCICPQCVIHGKHRDHDVKTIRKAHPVIKVQLESSLDRIQNTIQNLLIRKSQVEKNIRILTDQNNTAKRQIQSAFTQIRGKIDVQQAEMIRRCDFGFNQSVDELQKTTKHIMKRIEQLRSYSASTVDYLKKDQLTALNFYARKWRQINQDTRQNIPNIPYVTVQNNQKMLTSVLDLGDHVDSLNQIQPKNRLK